MNRGIKLKALIGIIFSGFFLAFAIRNVSFGQLGNAMSHANYLFLIPAVLLTLLVYWFRAIRWRYMLIYIKPIQNSQLFTITMIGFMVNNVLPVRIGEVVRAYLLGKRENLSKSLSLGTVVVERLLDSLTILSFAVPIIFLFSFPLWVKRVGIIFLVFSVGIVCFLFLFHYFSGKIIQSLQKLVAPISSSLSKRIGNMLTSFCEGLKIFKSKSQVFWICFYSYSIWIGASVIVLLILYSFHFTFPFYAPLFILAIIAMGAAIPSSPGFIGTLQFFCVAGLALFGIPESEALGFSIVYHASQYFPITLLGLFFMWKGRLGFKEITKKE
ncbi:MAG: flippase-like domain-containing protein [Deltaproteobacteria bacterium]|nr:flippase-like domain-containing protein [Deltaproteobacteria bacterium]